MRSFLFHFQKRRRAATLLYSVRTASEAAFLEELTLLATQSDGRIKVVVNVTGQDKSWEGYCGRIDAQYILAQVCFHPHFWCMH